MEQEKIWGYYQNHSIRDHVFPEARQRYLLRFLQSSQRTLNIGIGSGSLERLGLAKGVEMYSLDPSEPGIAQLRSSTGMGERAQVGYAQHMPFDDNFFDAVVMSEVLEHLDDDTLAASLSEVHRVLKPGGYLLASTPYREELDSNKTVCPQCGCVFHRWGHVQTFDKESMYAVITRSGLVPHRIWIDTFVDWKRKGIKNFVKSLIRVLLARMGEAIADPHLIVIAHKPK